jgi:hypothetical protein
LSTASACGSSGSSVVPDHSFEFKKMLAKLNVSSFPSKEWFKVIHSRENQSLPSLISPLICVCKKALQ